MPTIPELLADIKKSAIDPNRCGLATLLRKCRVLAAQLENHPLEDWILWESNGYPPEAAVPDYRVYPIVLRGIFSMIGGLAKSVPIPISRLPAELQKPFSKYKIRYSVAVIEQLHESEEDRVSVPFDDLISTPWVQMYENMQCLQVWGDVGKNQLSHILNSVRNRILEFSIALEKEAAVAPPPPIKGASGFPVEEKKVTNIFNVTVRDGGRATVIGSAQESIIESEIVARDFGSLSTFLKKNGIGEADIAELQTALKTEPEGKSGEQFSPRVSSWIEKMWEKAKEGAWDISLNSAKGLLQKALQKYLELG